MSQETRFSDSPAAQPQVTVVAGQSDADIRAAEAAEAEEWQVGDVILGLYEVKQVFTGGGMGLVYHVHHKNWNTELIIKAPRAEFFKTEAQKESFIKEARTWIELGMHPHLVTCYYVRKLGGIPRVFVEYAEGGSLLDWIRSGRLYEGGKKTALERILDISIQFAWGLAYAHEKHLVHQDVKPGNVVMTADGIAKVTDFGLTRQGVREAEERIAPVLSYEEAKAQRRTALAKARREAGPRVEWAGAHTQAYCSPEQAKGRPLTRRTDIYSWAVSVLEMFTGGVIWMSGEAAGETLEQIVEEGPHDSRVPEIPEDVAAILKRCLQAREEQRPTDLPYVVKKLQAAYNRIFGRVYPRLRPEVHKTSANILNNQAISSLDLEANASPDSKWRDVLERQPDHPEARFNLGLSQWRQGKISDKQLLADMEGLGRKSERNASKVRYFLSLVHLERGDPGTAITLLSKLAEGEDYSDARSLLDEARKRLEPVSGPLNVKALVNSRDSHSAAKPLTLVNLNQDGRALVGDAEGDIMLWKIEPGQESGKCSWVFSGHTGAITAARFNPKGRFFASGSLDNTLRVWDTKTKRCVQTFEDHAGGVLSVCFSPDGNLLYSGDGEGKVTCRDTTTWSHQYSYTSNNKAGAVLDISADGRYAIVAEGSGAYVRQAPDGNLASSQINAYGSPITLARFNPDGEVVLTAFKDGTMMLLKFKQKKKKAVTLKGHKGRVLTARFSPDGRQVLSAGKDGTSRLWDADTGKCIWKYDARLSALDFTQDGKFVLCADGTNGLNLWRIKGEAFRAPYALSKIDSGEVTERSNLFSDYLNKGRESLKSGDPLMALQYLKQARSVEGFENHAEVKLSWQALYNWLPRKSLNGAVLHSAYGSHAGGTIEFIGSGPEEGTLLAVGGGRMDLRGIDDSDWHSEPSNCKWLSPDGRTALVQVEPETLSLVELMVKYPPHDSKKIKEGNSLQTFRGHKSAITNCSISPDGLLMASTSADGELRLWETGAGRCLRTQEGVGVVNSLSFSPDAKMLLCGGGRGLRLMDVRTGQCLQTLDGEAGWFYPLIAPVRVMVAQKGCNNLSLWDVEKVERQQSFVGHEAPAVAVSFSSDGKFFLSGSADRTVRLWDVESDKCLLTKVNTSNVTAVYFSPDGTRAWWSCQDGRLLWWSLEWELEERRQSNWDEAIRRYLTAFIELQTPYAMELGSKVTPKDVIRALTRAGRPIWTEDNLWLLMHNLKNAGYGYVREEGVRLELEKMAQEKELTSRLPKRKPRWLAWLTGD